MALKITKSKYAFLSILSYVDYASKIRVKYLRQLNKKYNELSKIKEDEVFNMLVKKYKIIRLQDQRDLKRLETISLFDYELGLNIKSTLILGLLKLLRPYKKL